MATAEEKEAPPKKGKGGMLVVAVVGAIALGAGFAVPRLLVSDGPKKDHVEEKTRKPVFLPFGDLVVSLGEERHNRYLRLKTILVIDGNEEKAITEHFEKQKAYLKNWLIGYLSDLTLSEVSGEGSVNRLRREIKDQFNLMLWPDGKALLLEVLFDEFVVQ